MTGSLKPIFLIAGSPGRRRRPDPLFQNALKGCGAAAPRVGYVGAASDDDPEFFRFLSTELKSAGASEVYHALITPKDVDLDQAKQLLASADIIFVSGGDVARGIALLQEKGMDHFLRELYLQGKPFFGVSAGSIMLSREWVRWRDPEDDNTAEIFPCLGLAPIICDTHAEEDDWQELRVLLALEKDNVTGYGIPSGAAIKISPDGTIEAHGGAISRYVRRGQEVVRLDDLLPAPKDR